MHILVIDGQGGNIGRQLIKLISQRFPQVQLTAVGTNSSATANMMKGGATAGATGENAVKVGCRKADVIVGPLGIVITDSLLGEVTADMAVAVARSEAVKILIPLNRCDNLVAGVGSVSTAELLEDAMEKIDALLR